MLSLVMFVFSGGTIMYGAFLLFPEDFMNVVSISFTALICTEFFMVIIIIHTPHVVIVGATLLSALAYMSTLLFFNAFFGKKRNRNF